jgi:hypothetical protein
VANPGTPAVTAVNDPVPEEGGRIDGTPTVPDVIDPVTVPILNPTDLIATETVPLDTQTSPLPEDTYRSSSSGGGVVEQKETVKEEGAEAGVSGESNAATNQPSHKGDVANRSATETELASLVLTKEGLPDDETGRDERGPGVQKQDLRQEGALGVIGASTYEHLRDSLDEVKREIRSESRLSKVYLGSALVSSIGLSVGYVVWLLRGGMLLASLLSSMPAWQFLDPLPVLARKKDDDQPDDSESLESIVDSQPQEVNPIKETADGLTDAELRRR